MNPADLQKRLDQARNCLLACDYPQALRRYERLARECPGSSVIWFEYGGAASGVRDMALAERAWTKALSIDPRNSELAALIGHRYQGLRQPGRAKACFAQAALADPRAINPRISLAVLLEQNHQIEEARAAVADCLAIDPRDDQARYFAAVLDRREGNLEKAERQLRDLIASDPRHPFVRYACRYELAQVLDRIGNPDAAIELLKEAKSIVLGLTDTELMIRAYDRGADSARRFTQALPRDILSTWGGYFPKQKRSAIPPLAFLGGHPRSGTTLLEQILDAHPGVAALDEPGAFLELLEPAFQRSKDLSTARLNALRELYLRAVLGEAGPPGSGKLLLDKNPSPTARLPIWLKVFPELRVIIALRDPRDVVLSCYFQNIPLNAVNVNFLSLSRLGKHYADLMDIWLAVREWEGFSWVETRYEDLVVKTEEEGLRITTFLGLEWHDQQTRFYEKSRQKQFYSPTYQDVTLPIYARSVARWHAYEKHLAPVLAALQPYCRIFGYA